jgi:hypothetical protein
MAVRTLLSHLLADGLVSKFVSSGVPVPVPPRLCRPVVMSGSSESDSQGGQGSVWEE